MKENSCDREKTINRKSRMMNTGDMYVFYKIVERIRDILKVQMR